MHDGPIIFFDGVCHLCNRWVDFVIRRDVKKFFCFSPLESKTAEKENISIVLFEDGKRFTESTAILRIFKNLGGMWSLLYVGILIPRPLRDVLYRFVARHRYRWFGRDDVCRIPTPDILDRFL